MARPKHVAFLLNDFAFGGAERVVITLCNAMATRGIRVELLLSKKQGPLIDTLSDAVEITLLPASGRWRWMPALTKLAKTSPALRSYLLAQSPPGFVRRLPALRDYLRKERPDALFSTLTGNNLLAAWAAELAKVPTRIVLRIATTLSVDFAQDRKASPPVSPALLRQWYPRAHRIVCVSQGVKRDLESFIGRAVPSAETIYNPLDLQRIAHLSKAPVAHSWLNGEGIDCIVALGRLEPAKDYSTLLRAFARLDAERPSRLIILGEGSERGKLSALAEELGIADRVDLHGNVTNPFSFLAHADLYVLSSAYEGCPNALMEAMACGCRVVSTDCPSGPRELLQDGAIGPLVPVGDAETLAAAMAAELTSPVTPENTKTHAAEYALPSIVERYLKTLYPNGPNHPISLGSHSCTDTHADIKKSLGN